MIENVFQTSLLHHQTRAYNSHLTSPFNVTIMGQISHIETKEVWRICNVNKHKKKLRTKTSLMTTTFESTQTKLTQNTNQHKKTKLNNIYKKQNKTKQNK